MFYNFRTLAYRDENTENWWDSRKDLTTIPYGVITEHNPIQSPPESSSLSPKHGKFDHWWPAQQIDITPMYFHDSFSRFNSCFCLAVKANVVCKNGMNAMKCQSRKRAKRKLLGNWLRIFWHERQKWAHFWSGRISKSFTKGNVDSCVFHELFIMIGFFFHMANVVYSLMYM